MKVVRCLKGHYYDSDKYSFCPYCGAEVEEKEAAVAAEKTVPVQNNRQVSGGNNIAVDAGTGKTDRVYHNVVFKTPNMNVTGEAAAEFPQTVLFQDDYEGTAVPGTQAVPGQSADYYANADTSVLNGPVMPSIQPNYFRPVSEETTVLTSDAVSSVQVQEKRAVLYQVSAGKKYFLTKNKTIIGKVNSSCQNDISIQNTTVSRRHAVITEMNGRFFIEDLGSTNKTHINQIDIGSHRMVELMDNDRLVLSDEEFYFSII